MSKQTQMGFFPSGTSTKNQVLMLEGFNQLNQTEEPTIMESDNEINIQEPPLTCKNCIQNNGIAKILFHRTTQNISNN